MSPAIIIKTLTTPFQRFIRMEAASSILLISFALLAILWANSPWAAQYFGLWETNLSISINGAQLSKPLLLWINDGLMAIFFFLVGLEIKREMIAGELSSLRKATLPLFAALGGMIIPAGIFAMIHGGRPGFEGWGIPMATDIAFSLGILMLLGKRVPLSLKVFLTAFAIFDDIGAVLIIAIFYSANVDVNALLMAGGVWAILLAFNFTNINNLWLYILGGIVVWYFFLKSGIHPTVAGVLVALVVPANGRIRMTEFVTNTKSELQSFGDKKANETRRFLESRQLQALENIKAGVTLVQPPLQKLEHKLHGFVAFAVIPLFALANAGVAISGQEVAPFGWLTISIVVGLVLGKSLGVTFFTWLCVRMGLCDLPEHTTWIQIFGLGLLGGVGFTMALFISNLALVETVLLNQAKMGILLGSLIAGTTGFLLLKNSLKNKDNQLQTPVRQDKKTQGVHVYS